MQQKTSIERSARGLRRLAAISAVSLVLLAVAGALLPNGLIVSDGLPRRWGIALTMITVGLAVAGLLELVRMLRQVEGGRVFAPVTLLHFKRFALLFLLSSVAKIVLPVAAQLVLLVAAGGHGRLMVGISDDGLLALVAGALVLFVARVFEEAARLEDDSRSIV